jgi:hypothetical protein
VIYSRPYAWGRDAQCQECSRRAFGMDEAGAAANIFHTDECSSNPANAEESALRDMAEQAVDAAWERFE